MRKSLATRLWRSSLEKFGKRQGQESSRISSCPDMINFSLFIVYISFIFQPYGERTFTDWIIQVPCLLFSLLQLFMEGKQLQNEGASQYLASVGVIWNLLDIASSILV